MAKTSKSSGRKVIKMAPDLRIAGAAAAYASLRSAAEGPAARIAIDATQVEKVDAAGVQALLAGRKALEQAGRQPTWAGISPQLKAAAQLLGLAELLELE